MERRRELDHGRNDGYHARTADVWDDLKDELLDSGEVQKAQNLEIEDVRKMNVYDKVRGHQILGVGWVDVKQANGSLCARGRRGARVRTPCPPQPQVPSAALCSRAPGPAGRFKELSRRCRPVERLLRHRAHDCAAAEAGVAGTAFASR